MQEPHDDAGYVRSTYGQRFLLIKRQIWAGLRPDDEHATRLSLPRGAARARDAFMQAVGHDVDERHRPIDEAGGEKAAFEAMPRFFRAMSGMRRFAARNQRSLDHLSHCGWWWCQEADALPEKYWNGLSRALDTLVRQKIDPWDVKVGLIAVEWQEAEYNALELSEAQRAVLALEKLEAELDGISNVSTVVRILHRELNQRVVDLQGSVVVGSSGGPPKDVGRRATLRAAEGFDFQPSVVAAISVLACANPEGLDDFEKHRDAVNQTAYRMRHETK